jgi:uncharacterized protein (TIGR01777 family)
VIRGGGIAVILTARLLRLVETYTGFIMSRVATFTLRSPMPVSAEEVYTWHSRPLAFQRLQPPWERVDVETISGTFGNDGFRVDFRAPFLGPFKSRWVADFADFQPGRQFRYRQTDGPFRTWNHTLRFLPESPKTSIHENHIEYQLPLGALGRWLGREMVERRLAAMFAYRHALIATDLRRQNLYRDAPRVAVAVTGSRGLIGSELVPFLTTGGHRVMRLVTGKERPAFDDGTKWVNWDPRAKLDPATFAGLDAVIHLAGESVASGRWNARRKQRILESRTIPTRYIAEALAALPATDRPKTFVCASAVGFYGNRGDEVLTEDSPLGTGFLPDVCRDWEAATEPARAAGIRTTNLRTGIVLTPKGGALGKQLTPFKLGLGATLGSGTQWTPWITIGDMVGAIHHCLMNEAVGGPVNAVAPSPVTNSEFTRTLARVLGRPAFLGLPRFALRALFGELADEGLLASLRALPKKLLDTGFAFQHTELIGALRFVLGRS